MERSEIQVIAKAPGFRRFAPSSGLQEQGEQLPFTLRQAQGERET